MKFSPLLLLLAASFVTAAVWAQKKNDQLPERTEAEILKTVTLPEGYTATVFAPPPMGGYPTSVSAAIDGTIFVAIDENGSLGRDRNPGWNARSERVQESGQSNGLGAPVPPLRIPGKVIRMRDTDGDGHADEFKTFCEVESPRGVIWDGVAAAVSAAEGGSQNRPYKLPGTLYVMHPPNLTAYTDTDGDGKSDQQEDILTGLGFGLDFRGADHTTNGCRLAIDGFIYIAVGDYGFINAKARDGTTLTNRGGGIVRIRPDGTGFEIVSRGQRNIYDVAVSPTLDLFTRDNTNDGGGWNVRLSFVPPGAHMGYPYLFKNFAEDRLDALADLGGGSPCGALWLDEPGLPKGLFTVEWGANAIMYHDDLVPDGAGWKLQSAEGEGGTRAPSALEREAASPTRSERAFHPKQNRWLSLTRPTDMDVDATGALYITSWEGATFNYNGPNAGYVLRVVKKDAPKVEVPDLGKMKPRELVELTASDGAVVRQAAQRELLRKLGGKADADLADAAFALANDRTDQQRFGSAHAAFLTGVALAPQSDFNAHQVVTAFKADKVEQALTMIRGYGNEPRSEAAPLFVAGLREADPRVRAAAITALRRLGSARASRADSGASPESPAGASVPGGAPGTAREARALPAAAASILPLTADPDPVIAHLAVRALRDLKAVQPCLTALDSADDTLKPGALQALYGIYEPAVVDGLITRLKTTDPVLRAGILNALCRLANQDAPYEDPKVWWGTRPDTSGPVYQPIAWSETGKITAALKKTLDASNEEDAKALVARMYQTKVAFPGLVELMLAKAGNDTSAKLTAIEGMVRADNSLPPEGVTALRAIGTDEKEAPELRVRALRVFQKCADNGSVFPGAVAAFAPLAGHDIADAKIRSVFEDFTRGSVNGKWVGDYSKDLAGADPQKRLLAATVLVNLSTGKVGRENEREAAKKAVDNGFKKPESAAALLTAIARTGAKPLAEQVKAHLNDPNNAVAESALFAFQKLGLSTEAKPSKTIGEMKYEEAFAAVQQGGDAKAGQELYLRAGCIACHTITPDEPPKGPVLSAVAKIYDRAALTESLLKPNAKLAQGFESTWIKTKKGEQLEGFVTREGGDNLDLRNIAGQTVLVEKADIAERGHRDVSMMPEGLLNTFTPAELTDLLAWMESLKK